MAQYREITREVTITGGGGTARIWDAATGSPIKNMTIVISSGGTPTTAANITREVFYGGRWAGTPFALTSTHSGGVSQGSAALSAAAEIAHIIHEDSSTLPTNIVGSNVQHNMKKYGLPIVLQLTNNNVGSITLYVTFISEPLSTNV